MTDGIMDGIMDGTEDFGEVWILAEKFPKNEGLIPELWPELTGHI